ncbi:MAG TPA: hypothetical protein VKB57_02580 [Acidimicrobiales bacterium]|nr:hypothetical protein [Acidimicrobiales bacterium]
MNDPLELEEELRVEPWLRPYLDDRDSDLEPARKRFAVEQLAARRELRRAKVTVASRLHHGGLLTTALDLEGKRR